MKLFNAFVAAAVIGTSLVTANTAEARNGWVHLGTADNGVTHYVKPLGGSWPYRLYIDNTSDGPELKAEADCQKWRYRWVRKDNSRSPWTDVMPESWGEAKINVACR